MAALTWAEDWTYSRFCDTCQDYQPLQMSIWVWWHGMCWRITDVVDGGWSMKACGLKWLEKKKQDFQWCNHSYMWNQCLNWLKKKKNLTSIMQLHSSDRRPCLCVPTCTKLLRWTQHLQHQCILWESQTLGSKMCCEWGTSNVYWDSSFACISVLLYFLLIKLESDYNFGFLVHINGCQ